jgi:sterol desaturase/sphingolipid hydroxylase (fatty acid hydroxylase superfamily)
MSLVMYAIPFFILAMALEYAYGRARGRDTYRLADTLNSLSLGTLSRLSALVKLGVAGLAFEFVRTRLGLGKLPADAWLVWVVAFVGYDLCYYWSHRFGHQWKLFWASHVAHHQSEEFNLSTALRQTSTGSTFMFYLPLYLLGFPTEVVVTVGSLNLIYQFWVHTEHVPELGPLEWFLVTPSNHRVHHARNPCYIDRNYGGVFIVWDRLFGTYTRERPDEPCVYGITHQLASWNPLWANLHVWADTARDTLRTRRLRDKLKLWFTSPGWRPDDLPARQNDWRAPKYQPAMVSGSGALAFTQYWLVTVASLVLLTAAADLPYGFVLTAMAVLVLSFYVHGTLLEGRSYAVAAELVRLLILALAVGYWRGTLGPMLTSALVIYGGGSLAAAIWLFGLRPRLAAVRAGNVAGVH